MFVVIIQIYGILFECEVKFIEVFFFVLDYLGNSLYMYNILFDFSNKRF